MMKYDKLIEELGAQRQYMGIGTLNLLLIILCDFLSQATQHISHRVEWSVRWSVTLCFFCIFELFEGRKVQIRVFHGCLCPCPNQYCPCPTARHRGSRVYGLVSRAPLKVDELKREEPENCDGRSLRRIATGGV